MANLSNWIGIDDHADRWTIAHFRGDNCDPEREWELQPSDSGYRKLIGWLKELRGSVKVVYEGRTVRIRTLSKAAAKRLGVRRRGALIDAAKAR